MINKFVIKVSTYKQSTSFNEKPNYGEPCQNEFLRFYSKYNP
jgi:hypothetical protein